MTQHLCLCPLCGEGSVHEARFDEPFEYKGKVVNISLHCKECDVCGSEFADAAISKKNQRVINAAKKQVENLLDSASVAMLRRKWNVTQVDAGRIFGGGPVAFSKYESDDVVQSEAMDKLLRVADAVPEAKDWLFNNAGVPLKNAIPRGDVEYFFTLTKAAVSSLHDASIGVSAPTYTIAYPEVDVVIPVESIADPFRTSHLKLHKSSLVGPTVRLYKEEENQSYMHRPTYIERDYEVYGI